MPAGTYNLVIEKGATLSLQFTCKNGKSSAATPIDWTGYTARAQIRATADATEALHSMTTENDGIVLGGDDGTVTLQIPAATTAAMTFTTGVWALEMVNGDVVNRLLQGKVRVSPEIVR